MKKIDDRELQQLMDENRTGSVSRKQELTGRDAKAYQALYDVLDTEPLQGLPYDFSAKVTRKILTDNKRNSEFKFYILGIIVLTFFIGVLYILLLNVIKPVAGTEYISVLLKYKWALILGIFSFLTIQYLDQVLVKSRIFRKQ
ncbi:hypothetical protein HDF19_03130 [Mucilaginibacter sp. E4BP6]|uniref:hypothetical protein n=1 Tax=Mucilaginibacter sp. E4BP6 TaxID=2723089 RepID=UPI0015C85765|nr:hypothetical protein [Mucilaginibacter sp. E4BP6]NYE64457.1 hypothetical protein [Mucilaginibacter sp. E4BP6]